MTMPRTNVAGATPAPGSGAQLCAQAGEREHRTDSTAGTATATAAAKTRHYCRNPRCRSKLPAPVENEHRAFCARGCFESFYRSRCLVCEEPMRRKRESQRLKSGHRRCAAEYRKFPRAYDYPSDEPAQKGGGGPFVNESLAEAHFTGLKTRDLADRPTSHCLRGWWWGGDGERDHSLYDRDGLTVARIVPEGDGRYHLRTPFAIPRRTWAHLEEAKRRAENLALMAMPLAAVGPKLAARIKRDNETPHPMGPPLNRPPLTSDAIWSDWRPTGNGAGVPDIPDFLRRRPAP